MKLEGNHGVLYRLEQEGDAAGYSQDSVGFKSELKLLNQPSGQLISAPFPGMSIGRTSIKPAAWSIFRTGLLSQHLLRQLDSHQLKRNNNQDKPGNPGEQEGLLSALF